MMHVNDCVFDALFASPLQPSDGPTAETVAEAIANTVRRLGAAGCISRTAQEFGDHPDEAVRRMRWVRQLVDGLCGCLYLPTAPPTTLASAGIDLLPVRAAA